jgi:hypothetical protein
VVCVLLASLAIVQVAHIHPLETDADHCPRCIAIHAAAPVAVAAAVIILVQVGTPVLNDPNSACAATTTTLNGQPAVDLSQLTADQEFQAGLMCNGMRATPGNKLPDVCAASQFSSGLLQIPAPDTGNNDHNPARIAARNLFDMSVGKENLFHADRYKVNLDLTAVNITDKYALYNFLSAFSGTHYVSPRALTAKITLNF